MRLGELLGLQWGDIFSCGAPWARPLLCPETVPASCPAAPTYQRRQPVHTVLYRTVEQGLDDAAERVVHDTVRGTAPR
jgi:hypothetical protein